MVRVMHDLTSGVFENLEINSPMDVDKIVNCTQILLMGSVHKKYMTVLAECKELAKDISGDKWMLDATTDITMEQFWTWTKLDGVDVSGGVYLGAERCLDFKNCIWF